MSNTVPTHVKPSGVPVPYPSAAMLPSIPKQRKAKAPAPASSDQARLVPAKVGPLGRVQTVWIPCPTWCVVDHLEHAGVLEDVMHYSDADILQVATLLDDDTAHSELYANISLDPTAADPRLRVSHIVINDGAQDDAYLTPDMAEELADDLIAFGAQLREKARLVRLHNKAGQ